MDTNDPRLHHTLCALAAVLICSLACVDTSNQGEGDGDEWEVGDDDPPVADEGPVEVEAPEEWTWVEFPTSKCGNGQPTGLGVNLTDRSSDVVVFLQGGGACWDTNTCFVLNSAVNVATGYGAARFEVEPTLGSAPFDREDPENPFKDASYVFVPYCTGDLFSGDNVQAYPVLGGTREVHHVGAANMRLFLDRLSETFTGERKILLTGSSAGGYGAQLSYHAFAEAFPDAELHVLSDSGQMIQPLQGRWGAMAESWSPQTPAGCEDCLEGLPQWIDHLVSSHPESRFGLLAYDRDAVIGVYFGYPLNDDTLPNSLGRLLDDTYAPAGHAAAFVLEGNQHVMLGGLGGVESPSGERLVDWVRAWAEGDDAWATVSP
jgi:hypothetical protein